MTIIAHAHNGFTDKFGIPRQSREDSLIETRIVFTPPFRNPDAIRGIETYSHLWLIWQFSANQEAPNDKLQITNHKSPIPALTVRPPRLGGNTRVGVFASRSPFRPNSLGLTSVRLLRIETMPDGSRELIVSGADLLDGTPILDIKPYLAYSDSHPDATNGFAEPTKDYRLKVVFPENLTNDRRLTTNDQLQLTEILSQDPRPAYQHDPDREYKLDYAGWRVTFTVSDDTLLVKNVEKYH